MNQSIPFKSGYITRLLSSAKADTTWPERTAKCAHQIVKAVSFKETARSAFRKAENIPLSIIGNYYAVFHMEIAMLSIDYSVRLDQLNRMKHKRLENLVGSKFVSSGLFPKELASILVELRKIRESVNYEFCLQETDLRSMMPKFERDVNTVFRFGFSFVDEIDKIITDRVPLRGWIQRRIGDSIGDDLYSSYLSKDDRLSVVSSLLCEGLTT